MYLIDKQAKPGRPTNKHISREIYEKIYPHRRLSYRKTFTFKHQKPIEIEDDIAIYLLEHTETLIAVDPATYEELDIKDRFDNMTFQEQQNYGMRLGIKKAYTLKKDELKKQLRIRHARGERPISKEEQKRRHREKMKMYHRRYKEKREQGESS